MKPTRRAAAGTLEAKKYTPKRSISQREADLAQCSVMVTRGASQAEMVAWIAANRPYTLSIQQIKMDCGEIRARWREIQTDSVQEHVNREVALSFRVQNMAEQAYDRSTKEKTRTSQDQEETALEGKEGSAPGKRSTKRIRVAKDARDGDPRFLQVILTASERRAKMLGIDVQRSEHSGLNGEPIAVTGTLDVNNHGIDETQAVKALTRKIRRDVERERSAGRKS